MSQEENKKTEDQVNNMLPNSDIIVLDNSLTLEIKPLNWGKEIKVMKLVSGFFGESDIITAVQSISQIKDEDEDSPEALKILSEILIPAINDAPQAITEIVSIITERDISFIEESLTSEDVMKIFVPFFKKLFTRYTKMFNL
jgi:hypothetical protein